MSDNIILKILDFLKGEIALLFGVITVILFMFYGDYLLSNLTNPLYFSVTFVWLFCTMLWMSFSVVYTRR